MGRRVGRREASQAFSLAVWPCPWQAGPCCRAVGSVTGPEGTTFPVGAAYH